MEKDNKQHNLTQIYTHPIYVEEPSGEWMNDKSKLYTELPIDSVEKLFTGIKDINSNRTDHAFMDIGSGQGKILMHWLTMSACKNATGIEINQKMCRTSKDLYKKMKGLDKKKFKIVNKDVMKYKNFEGIVFINDLFFTGKETLHVWNNLQPDSILMTYKILKRETAIMEIEVPINLKSVKAPQIVSFYRKPFLKNGLISRLGLTI